MPARPTPVEIFVNPQRKIKVSVDGHLWPQAEGQLSFNINRARLVDSAVAPLEEPDFSSPREYRDAEARAGRALCGLLSESDAEMKPHQVVHRLLEEGHTIRLCLDFRDSELDEKPWELLCSPTDPQEGCNIPSRAGGDLEVSAANSTEPWGVHDRILLGRKTFQNEQNGGNRGLGGVGSRPPVRTCVVSRLPGDRFSSAARDVLEVLQGLDAVSRRFAVERIPRDDSAPDDDVLTGPVGIYHFLGHGRVPGARRQQLYDWSPGPIAARELKAALDQEGGSPASLYIIFACHGTSCFNSNTTKHGAGFEAVVQSGAPVVVATQALFNLATTRATTSLLYAFLAKGQPIDEAATNARRFARKVMLGLLAQRAMYKVDCNCIYTWRQLAVAYGDIEALYFLPQFSIDMAPKLRQARELLALSSLFKQLKMPAELCAATGPRQVDLSAPMIMTEEQINDVFPSTGPILRPYLATVGGLATYCGPWHGFESLKLAIIAAAALLCNERTLEEILE